MVLACVPWVKVEVHRVAALLALSPSGAADPREGPKPRARLALSAWPAALGFAPLSPQDSYAQAVAAATASPAVMVSIRT